MNHDEILANKANMLGPHTPNCVNCDEPVYFALRDNYHTFSLSLSTLLECLKFAENEGAIPPIDPLWWIKIANCFRLDSDPLKDNTNPSID